MPTDEERLKMGAEFVRRYAAGERCHACRDGDCFHKDCPQLRDGEPMKSGRHCPLDPDADDPYWGE